MFEIDIAMEVFELSILVLGFTKLMLFLALWPHKLQYQLLLIYVNVHLNANNYLVALFSVTQVAFST